MKTKAKMSEVVLEPSTNTHKINSTSGIEVEEFKNGTMKLKIADGNGIVTHGEHGTLKTESKNVVKYVQLEMNPITRQLQKAFD